MTTPDKQLILDRGFAGSYDKSIAGKVTATIEKLHKDTTTNGLHIEPIRNSADDRVRTARVDQFHRMVMFDLGGFLLLYGVYAHDDAYEVAAKTYVRVNPMNGAAEIRRMEPTSARGERHYTDAELKALVEARAAEMVALQQEQPAASSNPTPTTSPNPLGTFSREELAGQLGVDEPVAEVAVSAESDDELVAFLGRVGGWQGDALLDLATGTPLEEVRERYAAGEDTAAGGTEVGVPSGTDAVVRAVTTPRAASRFHLIEDDAALEKALASGDFEAWRLFLHPDQQEYVDKRTYGPFRLSGGAGTGKTVVLVHRAVRLARENPGARILVVSYTRNLVDMIAQQIRSLDPGVRMAGQLGQPGISVMTLDQVAHRVLSEANGSAALSEAMEEVVGWGVKRTPGYRNSGAYGVSPWDEAIEAVGSELPARLAVPAFFQSEYQEVVLPGHITDERAYLRAPRVGRGTRLGRNQRRAVWAAVQRYRAEGLASQAIDWDEAAAVAAAVLHRSGGIGVADHVLIDEGQDFTPTRWLLARACVPEGPDDLFIAEDSNQRIYGQRIVLGHFGIKVVGRSRRLRLNYRTTEQNLDLALKVLEGGAYNLDEVEDEQLDHSHERYISSRSGPAPVLLPARDLAHEYELAARLLKQWLSELSEDGLAASTLGILTRTKRERDALVRTLGEHGVPVAPVDTQDIPAGTPAVMTLHRAKGTEFSRVLLFEVSESAIPKFFPGSQYDEKAHQDSALRERSLLYVGATRARDVLAISWSKKASPFLPTVDEVHA
ncbi:3'-5' exonuclease [Kocuria marina]|uniref:3'-5' exonuclease n=1 Tax=Kocuria marina TaxID=223184 RepID=UPI0022E1FFA2|nr:3'-5' exonuclease [Kocuria marina]